MEEEVVFKFEVIDQSVKQKAGNIVWGFEGVIAINVIEDQLEVKGKFDKDEMLKRLKEIDEHVEIVPVEANKPSREDISRKYFGTQTIVERPLENAGSSSWFGWPSVLNKENLNMVVDGGMRAGAYVGGQINKENANMLIDAGVGAGVYVGKKINQVRGFIPKLKGEEKKFGPNKDWCVRQPLPVLDKEKEILNKNNAKNFKPPQVLAKKEDKEKILYKNKNPKKKEEKKEVLYKNNAKNKQHDGASCSKCQQGKKEKEKIQGDSDYKTGYTGMLLTTASKMSTFWSGQTSRDPASTQTQQTKTQYCKCGQKI